MLSGRARRSDLPGLFPARCGPPSTLDPAIKTMLRNVLPDRFRDPAGGALSPREAVSQLRRGDFKRPAVENLQAIFEAGDLREAESLSDERLPVESGDPREPHDLLRLFPPFQPVKRVRAHQQPELVSQKPRRQGAKRI